MNELEVGIRWIQKSLSVEGLEVDDLEPFRASDAESRLEEVDRTRFGRDVELLRKRKGQGKLISYRAKKRSRGER